MKRRTRYTARAAVLLLVFCALVLALAYPLQQYVSQSSQLDTERNQNAAKAVEVSKLKQQLAQWQDPAFVEIEARKRLHYVKPGEVGLRLLGPSDAAGGWTSAGAPGSNGTAWYSQLWNSITAAAASATPSQGTSATPGRPETPTPSGALPETPPSPSDH
jgi:cell division protein FtsB